MCESACNQVTQIFVAHTQASFRERLRGRNHAENIVRLAHQDLQVTVVADRSRVGTRARDTL
jgi:hypothetical protein